MIAPNNDHLFKPHTVAKSADGDTMELYESVFDHAPRTRPAVTERRRRRLSSICAIDEAGNVKTWLPLIMCVILAALALAVCWIVGVR